MATDGYLLSWWNDGEYANLIWQWQIAIQLVRFVMSLLFWFVHEKYKVRLT